MLWEEGGGEINFGVMLHPQYFYNKSYLMPKKKKKKL